MPYEKINGVNLYYERTGSGEPMIMVHGSWGDHNNWARVVPQLSGSFEVVTFDRRGAQPERIRVHPGQLC